MPGDVHEECGLALVNLPGELSKYPKGGAAPYLVQMLLQQQHRGQLGAGITTFNKDRLQIIDTRRDIGTVSEVFKLGHVTRHKSVMERYKGLKGIGHARYATSGQDDKIYAQPFERHHGRKWKWFSFCFNGNIANYSDLKKELEKAKYHLVREVDTELIMHYIAKQMLGETKINLEDAFHNISLLFDGAYNILFLNAEGDLIALRDPYGIRPLSYVKSDEGMAAVASEGCGLYQFGEKYQSLKPGEMLFVQNGNVEVKKYANSKGSAHCMFEYVYFSHPSSILDGVSVYEARWRLGEELAKAEPLEVNSKDYIVIPVPDTATPAAHAYGNHLGLPVREGLLRNRYVGRTFIQTTNREERVKEKYTLNKAVIKGKKLIVVEDSIVRGTTTKGLVKYLRQEGKVEEVHIRVGCPPIKYPCFYGIDMSTMSELIAPNHMGKDETSENSGDISENSVEKIRQTVGADSLVYLPVKSLVKGIGHDKKSLCTACLTGEYPTPCGRKLLEKARQNFAQKGNKRTYE